MTRSTGLGSLPELLIKRAGERTLERVFQAEGIPIQIIKERQTFLPLASMCRLFERSARAVGDRTFGLTVGRDLLPEKYGIWAVYSAQGAILREALDRASRTIRYHQDSSGLGLFCQGDHLIWRYFPPQDANGQMQHADHIIWPMISFCRAYLGADWKPDWIELSYRKDSASHLLEREFGCRIKFERPGVGIAFDARLLATKRLAPAGQKHTLTDVVADGMLSDVTEPLHSVIRVILLRLLSELSDIEGAAELLSMSVRTLQSQLQQLGVTYRDLLDRARLVRGSSLLAETDRSVADIAFALGYADPPNFTRAFKRISGRSPTEFRALHPRAQLSCAPILGQI